MPAFFLSYAREDFDEAKQIKRELAAEGVTVWCDQEQVHAGENWPRALGDAIATSDALLLLWSAHAAKSSFVELEWSTALALKKTILPCRLDQTPLPASLAAIHVASRASIGAAVRSYFSTLSNGTNGPEQSHSEKVLRQLGEIGSATPEVVLQEAKAGFAQSNWTVQGPVYQAAGDIHLETPTSSKTVSEKWQLGVAIIVGVLTAALGSALLQNYLPLHKKRAPAQSVQVFAGTISDDAGEPLAGVNISLLRRGNVVAKATTDSELAALSSTFRTLLS